MFSRTNTNSKIISTGINGKVISTGNNSNALFFNNIYVKGPESNACPIGPTGSTGQTGSTGTVEPAEFIPFNSNGTGTFLLLNNRSGFVATGSKEVLSDYPYEETIIIDNTSFSINIIKDIRLDSIAHQFVFIPNLNPLPGIGSDITIVAQIFRSVADSPSVFTLIPESTINISTLENSTGGLPPFVNSKEFLAPINLVAGTRIIAVYHVLILEGEQIPDVAFDITVTAQAKFTSGLLDQPSSRNRRNLAADKNIYFK